MDSCRSNCLGDLGEGQDSMTLSSLCSRVATVRRELSFYLEAGSIPVSRSAGVLYRGAKRSEIFRFREFYLTHNPEGTFGCFRLLLCLMTCPKLVVVACSVEQKKLIGVDFFYFNERDLEELTVHEGFIGVARCFEGRGIATSMRFLAKLHFASAGISGISSRISKDNLASMASARKAGFKPVCLGAENEKTNDEYYLVCDLESVK